MTTGITNIFNDIVSRASLTEEQRVTELASILGKLLPQDPWEAQEQGLLEPYAAFKRGYKAMYDDLQKVSRTLSESSLVVRIEPLAAEAAKCQLDDDVSETSPLRIKSAALRKKLDEERKMLADMAAPNAQLTAAYKTIIAAEEKSPLLPAEMLEESRGALRQLDTIRDPAFRANIQDSVGTILDNIDKQLDTAARHQHKLLEKKMFHKYLDAGLTTGGRPMTAPATARFRKVKMQP